MIKRILPHWLTAVSLATIVISCITNSLDFLATQYSATIGHWLHILRESLGCFLRSTFCLFQGFVFCCRSIYKAGGGAVNNVEDPKSTIKDETMQMVTGKISLSMKLWFSKTDWVQKPMLIIKVLEITYLGSQAWNNTFLQGSQKIMWHALQRNGLNSLPRASPVPPNLYLFLPHFQ
jgi:hypothetical protein